MQSLLCIRPHSLSTDGMRRKLRLGSKVVSQAAASAAAPPLLRGFTLDQAPPVPQKTSLFHIFLLVAKPLPCTSLFSSQLSDSFVSQMTERELFFLCFKVDGAVS